MTEPADMEWVRAASLRYLYAALDDLHARLGGTEPADHGARARASEELGGPSALEAAAEALQLDEFAREVVLLCTGFEVDPRFAALGVATPGMAFAALPDAHWAAFAPDAPLRRLGVLELDESQPLVAAPMRLAPDVLAFVLGHGVVVDDATFVPVDRADGGEGGAAEVVTAMRALLGASDSLPVVELRGAGVEERRAVAAWVAAALGTEAFAVDVRDLPPDQGDLARVLLDWVRGSLLGHRCLVVEVGDEPDDRVRAAVARVSGPLVVSGSSGAVEGDGARPVIRHDVPSPTVQERRARWAAAFASAGGGPHPPAALDTVAGEYRLGPSTVAAVCAEALAAGGDIGAALREACRRRTRALLDPLADRVDVTRAAPLMVPSDVRDQLDQLVEHVRSAADVQARWPYDLPGVAAMFAGPSGTGKTLAAAEVAARAGLDLYRVDLSLVVSKYVGETEKNLRRIFAGADQGGALLLFDEADALFGKRTDTRDGHDRYANLEVAYLLQRIEQSRAPSILTTNIADALDPAFLRRLRFVVTFPFPDEEVRAQLWRASFQLGLPTKDVDVARLARLGVHGAAIRDIALRAAVLAGGTPVTMALLREATRAELRKEGRDVPPEVAGWS
jgi:hypothetical protein